MQNIVLTNKPSKLGLIKEFIRSRGISSYIVLSDADDVYDSLLVEASNLHIFDFYTDMSIVNVIRELHDRINVLNVYVASVEGARPYMALTDTVQIMPEEYDVMSFFWDSEACNAKNVIAFQDAGMMPCKIMPPKNIGRTKELALSLSTQKVDLKYRTQDGRLVSEGGVQIVVSGKQKAVNVSDMFKIRDQKRVYFSDESDEAAFESELEPEHTDVFKEDSTQAENLFLEDAEPSSTADDTEPKPEFTQVFERSAKQEDSADDAEEAGPPADADEESAAPQTDKALSSDSLQEFATKADEREAVAELYYQKVEAVEPKQPASVREDEPAVEKQDSAEKGITFGERLRAGFKKRRAEAKAAAERAAKEEGEKKEQAKKLQEMQSPKTYVSFTGFEGGAGQASASMRRAHRRAINTTYATIAEYCLANKFISQADHDELLLQVKFSSSKDAAFGDMALEKGLITEEQLIKAISSVKGIEVMTWSEVENIKPDFSLLLKERCLKYKIFKVDNESMVGASPDSDILIATTSLVGGANEMWRMFDRPIIRYTLDRYITRKLEE